MTPEFDLIARYFTRPPQRAILGVGDDCALIGLEAGHQLAISTDTLVSGVHFFPDVDARSLGHKALAVNLSDLAAMGAAPRYATLALTLPAVDNDWLAEFSAGFFALADRSDIELIGGDTTRGPLSITVTVMGAIKVSGALRRDTAQAGDDIWVSGTLGGAAAALRHLQRKVDLPRETLRPAQAKLERPEPRNALGERLVDVAHAAIDISDGLIADLGHICERSRLCANVDLTSVPRDAALTNIDARVALECMLTGGDDYELCFTVPPAKRGEVVAISRELNLPLTRIGHMCEGAPSAVVRDANGGILHLDAGGFDHFPGHVDAS